MSTSHTNSGEILPLQLGGATASSTTSTVVTTDDLELHRILMPPGEEIETRQLPGSITLHCLEGKISVNAHGRDQIVDKGQMLYLQANEPHSIKAMEQSAVLITAHVANKDPEQCCSKSSALQIDDVTRGGTDARHVNAPVPDVVDEASMESFPASDPPAHTGITHA